MNTATTDFKKNLALSTVAHFVMIAVLAFCLAFAPRQKSDVIQWVSVADFGALTATPTRTSALTPPRAQPQPPRPQPREEVLPEPPQPKAQKVLPPQPKPTPTVAKPKADDVVVAPKTKQKVEVNKKLVTRTNPQSTTASKPASTASGAPKVSAEDWKKQVSQKLTSNVGVGVTTSSSSSGRPSEFGWYYMMIRDAMYANWQEPAISAQFTTRVTITVARDGRVLVARLTTLSGNATMDESVLTCARTVTQLEPLPSGLGGATVEIYIDFKLNGGV